MTLDSNSLVARAERYVPRSDTSLSIAVPEVGIGVVADLSLTGLGALFSSEIEDLEPGTRLRRMDLTYREKRIACGSSQVVRVRKREHRGKSGSFVGLRFDSPQVDLLDALAPAVQPRHSFGDELRPHERQSDSKVDAYATTIDRFYCGLGPDIFTKCTNFRGWMDDMLDKQVYQRLYRLTVTGPLDHRITVFDPELNGEREMICFDSNSYLGLHRHPAVIERTIEVTRRVGYGTASAQLLCGTNRYLCELEEALSEFHGREATLVFPTGFAANIGAINALIRKKDALIRDQLAHASIHEGCRSSRADFNKLCPHNDMAALDTLLTEAQQAGCKGKLVVTDGVFSMHGRIAPVPELVEICRRHNARLMVDDAHGLGVLGPTGGGIEEHFDMPGSIDVLMGTLSKTLGAVGGYISGSRDLINYLRFFAASGMFTTALPAALCAGATEALRLIRAEPEHRERLWANIRTFVPALRDAGFIVSDALSPIITIFAGDQGFMYKMSLALSAAGIKCGNVAYPAISKGESILRFTVNARHTEDDLGYAIDTLKRLGRDFGILNKSPEEILQIGRAVATANIA